MRIGEVWQLVLFFVHLAAFRLDSTSSGEFLLIMYFLIDKI